MIAVRVIVQQVSNGYVVSVPGVPGINARGETELLALDHARRLIYERLLAQPLDPNVIAGTQKIINLATANA